MIPQFTVGDRLRKAREVTGLEQGEFAEALGVSRNTVGNYESGNTMRLKPIVLKAWSLRTGVPLVWLETGAENPHPVDPDGGSVRLPRLDSNQRPSDYTSALVIEGPWGGAAERRAA